MKTKVVFKILFDEVIALFPDLKESDDKIKAYNEHGLDGSVYIHSLYELVDATASQYSQLQKELISIGYDLQIENLN